MPSAGKVIRTEERDDEFIVVVKIRGPGTKNLNSPVAKRAKFTAAREVGVLADYVPTSIREIRNGVNINKLMEGRWMGSIENIRTLQEGIQQTVLYGIRITK